LHGQRRAPFAHFVKALLGRSDNAQLVATIKKTDTTPETAPRLHEIAQQYLERANALLTKRCAN
jgi:hypothetical protein